VLRQTPPALAVLVACGLGTAVAALAFATDPLLGLAALAAPVALVVAASPAIGAALLLFALPLEELGALTPGGMLTLHKLLGMAVIGAWAVQALVRRQRIRLPSQAVWPALFVGWAAVSTLWAVDTATATRTTITFVQLLFLYVMLVNTLDTPAAIRRALLAHVAGALVLCGLGFWLAGQGLMQAGRAAIVVNHELLLEPNAFAAALLLPLAICVGLGGDRTRPALERAALTVAGGVFVTTILLTMSRGALVAGVVMILVVAALRGRLLLPLAAGLLAIPGILIVGPELWQRLAEGATLADRGAGRLDIWRVGWEIIREHPLFGVGIGGFPLVYFDYLSQATGISWRHVAGVAESMERFPHNAYVGATAELGVVGLVLLVATLGAHLGAAFRSWRRLAAQHRATACIALTGFAALLALTVLGGSIDTAHRKYVWLGLALSVLPAMRLGGGMAVAQPFRRAA